MINFRFWDLTLTTSQKTWLNRLNVILNVLHFIINCALKRIAYFKVIEVINFSTQQILRQTTSMGSTEDWRLSRRPLPQAKPFSYFPGHTASFKNNNQITVICKFNNIINCCQIHFFLTYQKNCLNFFFDRREPVFYYICGTFLPKGEFR